MKLVKNEVHDNCKEGVCKELVCMYVCVCACVCVYVCMCVRAHACVPLNPIGKHHCLSLVKVVPRLASLEQVTASCAPLLT